MKTRTEPTKPALIEKLQGGGFTKEEAIAVLKACKGNPDKWVDKCCEVKSYHDDIIMAAIRGDIRVRWSKATGDFQIQITQSKRAA
jgi:hypothetical protein